MRTALLTKVVPAVVGLVAAATLAHWVMAPQDNRVVVRVPGLDGYNAEAALGAPVDIKGEFKAGDGKPGTFPGSWPQFNGPARDGIATDKTPLLRSFPTEASPRCCGRSNWARGTPARPFTIDGFSPYLVG